MTWSNNENDDYAVGNDDGDDTDGKNEKVLRDRIVVVVLRFHPFRYV